MSESDVWPDNVPCDELVESLLLRFDEDIKEGRSPDWNQYLNRCPDANAKAELLALMIRSEQGHSSWDPVRIKDRLLLYPDPNSQDEWTLSLVRKLYDDRIETDDFPSLHEFAPLGLPIDRLQLQTGDDELYLGYAVGQRYRLEQRVGVGGYGRVYRAMDTMKGCTVAVKVAHGSGDDGKAQAKRLLEQESQALKALPHAGIPRLLDLTLEGGTLCMVMDFVDGQTLHHLRRQGPLAPERAAKIVAHLAETLHFIHRHGYLHRDLSPSNVLIDQSDVPFLMDFGLADLQTELFDRDRQSRGTPGYMSVESVIGATREIDPRDDIWSLGVILYELLTGHATDVRHTMPGSYEAALNFEKQLADSDSTIPQALRPILQRCVADDPDDRYDVAGLVARELRGYLGQPWAPLDETRVESARRRLLAWRAGFHFGVAYLCHTWARRRLSSLITESKGQFENAGVAFQMVMSSEKGSLDDLLKCTASAAKSGMARPQIAGVSEFIWIFNNRRDRPDLKVCMRLSEFMDEVDRALDLVSTQLTSHADKEGSATSAVLRLAVLCGSQAVGESVAPTMQRLSTAAKLSNDGIARYIASSSGEQSPDERDRERDRLNKYVERELMYQLADALDGDSTSCSP
jgi:serine/threonine-protein kinase